MLESFAKEDSDGFVAFATTLDPRYKTLDLIHAEHRVAWLQSAHNHLRCISCASETNFQVALPLLS
jgi:hypothetical protein